MRGPVGLVGGVRLAGPRIWEEVIEKVRALSLHVVILRTGLGVVLTDDGPGGRTRGLM
jgi:hypothetical protein